jgi:hypothetical protein
MQIPILSGIFTDGSADFRTSYPVNLIPVPKQQGISGGYLRPAEGITQFIETPGVCRGAVNWQEKAYFVCGDKLIRVEDDGEQTLIKTIDDDGLPVAFAFSFDRLGIASAGKLYYLKDDVVSQVIDEDLGTCVDVVYLDGYFVSTDGEFLIVTELNNPESVNALKYGSSEIDPDPVKGLLINRNELYALNRYTIEVFTNVGGEFFPFARITGAHMQKGAVGRDAFCVFNDTIAFVGSGRGEAPAVYMGENAQTVKISTREIDQVLAQYQEEEMSQVFLETRTEKGHKFLYIHLPDRTLVYDSAATIEMREPVWFTLCSSTVGFSKYRARHFLWIYNRWLCGDPTLNIIGTLTDKSSDHYGSPVRWEFGTTIAFADSGGAIVHELELISLTGRVASGTNPMISASYTHDGLTWSQDRFSRVGMLGDRMKRITWMQQGAFERWRAYRFRGTSDAFVSFARLEAKTEPLIR